MDNKRTSKIALSLPPIEIPQADYEKLKEASGVEDPTPKIVAWVKYLLANQANGGITLSAGDVKRIEDASGSPISSGRNVVDIALKNIGREDGQHTFKVQLDPAWIAPAEEAARAQGVELQRLIEDALNLFVENGWLYSWSPEGGIARFSKSDWAELCSITGKPSPFGADIVAALKESK